MKTKFLNIKKILFNSFFSDFINIKRNIKLEYANNNKFTKNKFF